MTAPSGSPEAPRGGRRNVLRRPACLVGAGYAVIVGLLLLTHEGDPLFFATLGPQWARHDPAGAKRADGMIFYGIAVDPLGKQKQFKAYRLERIFYPLLARGLAAGRTALIPWALLFINWASIVLGTVLIHRVLSQAGAPSWMALAYGAWGGLAGALLRDTSEPLAYALALLGIWGLLSGRTWLGLAACCCAILSRETVVLLIGPYLVFAAGRTRLRRWLPILVVAALWLAWILSVRYLLDAPVGRRPRLIPFRGLLWTRPLDLPLTLVALIIPAVVAIGLAVRGLFRDRTNAGLWSLLLNAMMVLSIPPYTAVMFWHSGRVSTGLVASTLLATSLNGLAPRTWRVLALLYVSSALWTIAVVARYVFFGEVILPGT